MKKLEPEERVQMRRTYVRKIMNTVRRQGFLSLTIQDLACLMGISRASLYNYFSSKEDIIMELTKLYIHYLRKTDKEIQDDAIPFEERLVSVFEQSVLSAIYSSDNYLNDLKASCPVLYGKKLESKRERLEVVRAFYRSGMEAGIFRRLNPDMIIMQEEAGLRTLFHTPYLVEAGLSLKQALHDCYAVKRATLLKCAETEPAIEINALVESILERFAYES